jgi:hypothetical protein
MEEKERNLQKRKAEKVSANRQGLQALGDFDPSEALFYIILSNFKNNI